MKLRSLLVATLLTSFALWNVKISKASDDATERIDEASKVIKEIMGTPEKGIPRDLLSKAHCVAVIPGLKKAGFVVGGEYGKGVITCRNTGGTGWTGPSTIKIEGGSFGLQIGGSEVDLVLLVMNEHGADQLMRDKFTIGADATAAAGPLGRTAEAETNPGMRAEILSYSRSRGVFAGIVLKGATLRPDSKDNQQIYGREVAQADILKGKVDVPPSARGFIETLNTYSTKERASSE